MVGALLQRYPEQHCLMILPSILGPSVHSYFMLVLGHLGAQRLLRESVTFDSAKERRWQVSASLQEGGRVVTGRGMEVGEGCFPCETKPELLPCGKKQNLT